jgi:hypothetical protein
MLPTAYFDNHDPIWKSAVSPASYNSPVGSNSIAPAMASTVPAPYQHRTNATFSIPFLYPFYTFSIPKLYLFYTFCIPRGSQKVCFWYNWGILAGILIRRRPSGVSQKAGPALAILDWSASWLVG